MSMGENHNVTEFVFVGLSQDPAVQKALFVLFTLTYIVTMLGNLLIALTVIASPSLNSPMYFFLACLSVLDVLYCNTISPNLIIDLFYNINNISFRGCLFQLFVEHLFGGAEVFLLVFMAYDRYVAICKPLHYLTIMNQQVCIILLLVSGVGGMVHSVIQVLIVYKLPFCGPNVIDHFMCDMNPLLVLACTDTYFLGITNIANGGVICVGIFTLLLVSYGIILNSLKSYSQEGRLKALYTCSSHIMVVICFFAPSSFVNARPVSIFPIDKYITVFYTVVSPMLNPLIYTLRNSEMKNSIKKFWYKTLTT